MTYRERVPRTTKSGGFLVFSRRLTPAAALLVSGFALAAFSLTFTHLAGSDGGPGFEDGPAASARFKNTDGVAVDGSGNVYVSDAGNHTIRVISGGSVTTLAGLAETPGSANGHGAAARFNTPGGLVLDESNNLYVADSANHMIRRITPAGVVTTLAGNGTPGFVNASGTSARLWSPEAITLASDGALYVADTGNHAIRRVTMAGVVTTLAGTGTSGEANGTGTAASFTFPNGITFNATTGHLYVSDTFNHVIRQITIPGAVVTTFAGTLNSAGNDSTHVNAPWGITTAADGNMYVAANAGHSIRQLSTSGTFANIAGSLGAYPGPDDGVGGTARFRSPTAVTISGSTLHVADNENHTVRSITLAPVADTVSTLAGKATASGFVNGSGESARFGSLAGIAYYPMLPRYVFIADPENHAIRRADVDGTVTTVAGGVFGYQEGTGAGAHFRSPQGIAADGSTGIAYVADTGNHIIRTVAGYGGPTQLIAGTPSVPGNSNGDGLSEARFSSPRAVAQDENYVYIADTGNRLVRRLQKSSGQVITLAGSGAYGLDDGVGTAASFGTLSGISVDGDGNVYVADSELFTIRKITPDGVVTTMAGGCCSGAVDGTGTAARFGYPGPTDIEIEGGLAWIADPRAHLIRSMTLPGAVVQTAGGRVNVSGTSPGTGTFARFNAASHIAAGNDRIFVAEGHRIRYGEPEIADRATIDSATGAVGAVRQLDTAPQTATTWLWEVIRRPAGSTAALSSASVRNPTFTPDVADLYVFRCTARSSAGVSISTIELQASGVATKLIAGYPGPKSSGDAFSHTVMAFDAHDVLADGYTGTVKFTSSDPQATLPGDYTFVAGDHGQHTFSVTLRTFGNQTVTVTDTANSALTTTMAFDVILNAPSALAATATSSSNVALTWVAASGAQTYDIERRSSDSPSWTTLVSGVAGTAYNDATVTANRAYLYRARSNHPSAPSSNFGTADPASTFPFTNDPIASGTAIRAVHLSELRNAEAALRAAAGLAPAAFTDPTLTTATVIKAVHVSQLRTAVNQARNAAGIGSAVFTDATLSPGTTVKAIHIAQLRSALR